MKSDPDLTHKVLESMRLQQEFKYFLFHYARIEDKENHRAIPFELWPEQERVLPSLENEQLVIMLKARQLGLTWLCAAYCLWMLIKEAMQLIIVISVTEELSIEFLDRVYFILDRLPEWVKPKVLTRTKQVFEVAHHDGLSSTIKSLPTTEMGAQSKTPTILILDETSRNRLIGDIYAASLPGIDAAKGRVIVISNSIKTAPGWPWTRGIYTGSMAGANSFKRIFLSWRARPDRPDNFKAVKLMEGMDEEDFIQHYPETEEEAISTMGGSYFGAILGRHTGTRKGEVGEIREGRFSRSPRGIVELFTPPMPGWSKRYAIGSDISEGLGQSYSVAYVIDRFSDEIVCRMRSNRVDASEWANMLYGLSKFYLNALICPERTGAGQTTVKDLMDLRANLYVRMKPGVQGNPMTRIYGWEETDKAKHELSGDLKKWLKQMEGTLYCGILLDECSTWIKHDNGSVGPEGGKLGDCVIAAGLAVQASKYMGGAPVGGDIEVREESVQMVDATYVADLERKQIASELKFQQEMEEQLLSFYD